MTDHRLDEKIWWYATFLVVSFYGLIKSQNRTMIYACSTGGIMRIIATSTLIDYYTKHPETEQPLKAWIAEVRKANWQTAHDIKAQYKNASILKNRRVVFNIKGNDHRLIVAVAFRLGAVYIKFIGTHAEYDRINADEIEP